MGIRVISEYVMAKSSVWKQTASLSSLFQDRKAQTYYLPRLVILTPSHGIPIGIHHVPGKCLYTANTLSRAPVNEAVEETKCSTLETELFVQVITAELPAIADHLAPFSKAQANDRICSNLIEFCKSGWPTRNHLSRELKEYLRFRGNMTLINNALLLYQAHIVILSSMRRQALAKIHNRHQGIQRCRLHVSSLVWWPGVTSVIGQFVEACSTCQRLTNVHSEPLLTTPLPSYAWEQIAPHLLELMPVADYYSRFVEVQKLTKQLLPVL